MVQVKCWDITWGFVHTFCQPLINWLLVVWEVLWWLLLL